jgi:hypothetical protein
MIDRPIFVVGAGRSGSSLFHQIFTEHPRVAWMSTLCDRHPDNPRYHRALMRGIDFPVVGSLLRRRWESAECYGFWDHFYRGFSQPCRDLYAEDATPHAIAALRRAVAPLVTARRSRLLTKITGWPRLGFLHAVFPDARFINVYRDGRAVANSLLQVDFWRGWQGPNQWRWGELDPAWRAEWQAHNYSFVALAGIQWKILMRALDVARQKVPAKSFLDVRYEDFAAHPVETFRQVADFCGLESTAGFERAVASYKIESANYKWQRDLNPEQQATLHAVLAESLAKYGYA